MQKIFKHSNSTTIHLQKNKQRKQFVTSASRKTTPLQKLKGRRIFLYFPAGKES